MTLNEYSNEWDAFKGIEQDKLSDNQRERERERKREREREKETRTK